MRRVEVLWPKDAMDEVSRLIKKNKPGLIWATIWFLDLIPTEKGKKDIS